MSGLMRNIINNLFSDRYVNHAAVVNNAFLLLMYRVAYPFAVLLIKLRLSPNKITTLSLIFSILAFTALIYDEGRVWFVFFWSMTVLLDFCDGTVARMVNNVSKSAFRYDHMSDLVKISLVILGVGFRYDDYWIWCIAFVTSFVFLYSDILNYQFEYASRKTSAIKALIAEVENGVAPRVRLRDRSWIVAWIGKYEWMVKGIVNLYSALLTVNGHTLLVFLMFPMGKEHAMYTCLYLVFISSLAIRSNVSALIKMKR